MTEVVISIGGKDVKFRSSAAIPRLYRLKFGRDILVDMEALQKDFANQEGASVSSLGIESLEIFENVAYIMARHADPEVPADIDEWLEQFETFDIYQILPEIFGMWATNMQTDIQPKKK
jgi:hypothetical protein